MLVRLIVGNKIIELRQFPDKNLSIEGYIEGLKKDMIEQNEDVIDLTSEKPEFEFEVFPDPDQYKLVGGGTSSFFKHIKPT
jgi:hypothetical protein